LKIKVLASRLNNTALFDWVDKELTGYDNSNELPKYRIYGCSIIGNYINSGLNVTGQKLSINYLPDPVKKRLRTIEYYESISVLESYIKDASLKSIKPQITPELITHIMKSYHSMGNPDFNLYSAYKRVGKGTVEQTIAEVRNYALELVLKLEQEFGNEIEMSELIRKKKDVNQIIYHIMNNIIHNYGDANLINTGSNSTINNKVNIEKNNFESLRKLLTANYVAPSDINELQSIIDEQPDYEKGLFGPKVSSWTQKMFNKSLDGSWQVGIGAAGTILGEALKKYYGM